MVTLPEPSDSDSVLFPEPVITTSNCYEKMLPQAMYVLPTLIFSWGNPSRGDDALGPLAYDWLQREALPGVELLTDFQLQIEHVTDLADREQVVFIDASVAAAEPFEFCPVTAIEDDSYSSHAMSPQALLAVYEQVYQRPAPIAWLMAVRGYKFGLGLEVTEVAMQNLQRSVDFIRHYCANPKANCSAIHSGE